MTYPLPTAVVVPGWGQCAASSFAVLPFSAADSLSGTRQVLLNCGSASQ